MSQKELLSLAKSFEKKLSKQASYVAEELERFKKELDRHDEEWEAADLDSLSENDAEERAKPLRTRQGELEAKKDALISTYLSELAGVYKEASGSISRIDYFGPNLDFLAIIAHQAGDYDTGQKLKVLAQEVRNLTGSYWSFDSRLKDLFKK